MNTLTVKFRKLALCTSIIMSSSFLIVACDNGSSPEGENESSVAQKPQAMSSQEQFDFVKNVMNNFIAKYNSAQHIATASITRFTLTQDQKQILMDVDVAFGGFANNKPNIIKMSYLITPEQTSQNNEYTVAKFSSQSISLESNDDSSNHAVNQFVKQSGLLSNGYVMASGDVINNIKSTNDYHYENEQARWDELKLFDFSSFNYHSKTKNNMSLIDFDYQFPEVVFNTEDVLISAKNINIKALNRAFDKNFNYTGNDIYKADAISIEKDSGDVVTINNLIWESNTKVVDDKFVDVDGKTSFTGTVTNSIGENINFSANANMTVNHLNLNAIQKVNQFAAASTSYRLDQKQKYVLDIIKDGFSFGITDSHIKLNDVEGVVNFSLGFEPLSLSPETSINVMGMRMLNNVSISLDSKIPAQWLSILNVNKNKNQIDEMINQSIKQIDMLGYNGALTYDGKTIVAKFEIKKGNVFVNGELKGSLLNSLAGLM